MTQEMTSGAGRDVVYTLEVATDPNAKAELRKFKQAVQEAFKECGPNQAEKRDQAMRGPQINIERMRSQVQQERERRQYDVPQRAEQLNARPASQTRQSMFQVEMPNHGQTVDSLAGNMPSDHDAPTWAAGPQLNSIPSVTAGDFRGAVASRMTSGDHNSGDLQKSISTVVNALIKLAQALGSADRGATSRRNAMLQRANRDAAFG